MNRDFEDVLKLAVLILLILCALRLFNLWSAYDGKSVDNRTVIPNTPQTMMPDCGRHRTLVREKGDQLIYLCEQ